MVPSDRDVINKLIAKGMFLLYLLLNDWHPNFYFWAAIQSRRNIGLMVCRIFHKYVMYPLLAKCQCEGDKYFSIIAQIPLVLNRHVLRL